MSRKTYMLGILFLMILALVGFLVTHSRWCARKYDDIANAFFGVSGVYTR